MILNDDILIYAVYKHSHPRKLNEHFLKSVPSYAEAQRIRRQLMEDPGKAANIARLIFRAQSNLNGGK